MRNLVAVAICVATLLMPINVVGDVSNDTLAALQASLRNERETVWKPALEEAERLIQLRVADKHQVHSALLQAMFLEGSERSEVIFEILNRSGLSPVVVPELIEITQDSERSKVERLRALELFGNIVHATEFSNVLAIAIRDEDPDIRCTAIEALEGNGWGQAPLSPLFYEMDVINLHGNGYYHEPVARRSVWRSLHQALNDESLQVRHEAVLATQLCRGAPLEVQQRLLDLLDDPSIQVKGAAAVSLGRHRVRPAADRLAAMLSSDQLQVALYAADGLRLMGPEALPALPAISQAIVKHDQEEAVRDVLYEILKNLGPRASDALPEVLAVAETVEDDINEIELFTAVAALGLHDRCVAEFFAPKIKSDDYDVRVAALAACGVAVEAHAAACRDGSPIADLVMSVAIYGETSEREEALMWLKDLPPETPGLQRTIAEALKCLDTGVRSSALDLSPYGVHSEPVLKGLISLVDDADAVAWLRIKALNRLAYIPNAPRWLLQSLKRPRKVLDKDVRAALNQTVDKLEFVASRRRKGK
jgi:HEAT repeat protein